MTGRCPQFEKNDPSPQIAGYGPDKLVTFGLQTADYAGLQINPKFNQVVPWSLHTFSENFMQIGPAVFS